jgi:hypothetical protein
MIAGELVGEQLKLVVEGVSNPVLLSELCKYPAGANPTN